MIMGNTMPLRDPDEDEEDEGEEEEKGEERADEPPLVREPKTRFGLSGGCPSAPKRGSSRP